MWFANEVRIVAAMITIDTQRGLYDSHLYDQDDLAGRPILRISLTSDGVSGAGIDGWTNSFLFWEHNNNTLQRRPLWLSCRLTRLPWS